MEKARKNNKGFSLVELIVVVLIIAIIAVALAPQVMKYVGKARTGTEANNIATIKSAVQAAVADYQADGGLIDEKATKDTTYTLTPGSKGTDGVLNKGTVATNDADNSSAIKEPQVLKTCIENTTGKDIPEVLNQTDYKNSWTVTVDKNGAVTVKPTAKTGK